MITVSMTFKEMVDILQKKGYVSASFIHQQGNKSPIRVGTEISLISTDTPKAVAKILVNGLSKDEFKFSVLGLVTSAGKTIEELVDFMGKVNKKSLSNV